MPIITLPDGSQRHFDQAITVQAVAANIGAGLAKAAIAGRVNDQLVDLSFVIEQDAQVAIITQRDPAALDIIRHSAAHLLAQAVKRLFPNVQVTIGPVIDDGFYYDFAYERAFTPEDLEKIEAEMQQIVQADLPIQRLVMSRDQAIAFFQQAGELYKVKIIEDIAANETLSLYQQGEFIDLCRGPHVPNTGKLAAFKLTKLAGAYWRGDANNEMLQRIYGTAWTDQKTLQDYLQRLAEAEKRDHRKIGKALNLFHGQEEAPGMIFWHANGWTIYRTIEQYIRQRLQQHDYQEVRTPILLDRSLWEKSGHWEMYGKLMFITESESRHFAVKPMNCPCHVQIFKQGLKSYRDLPLRMAEFGSCHRDEPSGTLHGLMRVRNFTQDDAHIFCTEEQIQSEAASFIQLLLAVYRDFGFNEVIVKLSTRPEIRVGTDDLWDKAEQALQLALEKQQLSWELQAGEGAFYGPKLEFSLRDCLGRVWQCGTLQLDYCLPERLDASYIAEDGSRQRPVMLHRAILGSLERFIGIVIEHHGGIMPSWLAPTHAVVMNITDRQLDQVNKVTQQLKNRGFRVISDLRNEKIGFKIREHVLQRVPYLLIIGDREVTANTLAVRTRGGDDLGHMSLEQFCDHLSKDIAQYSRQQVEEINH